MVTVLFFEVRSKTRLFEMIVSELRKNLEIEVYWVVQNQIFKPENDKNVFILKRPKLKDYRASPNDEIDKKVAACDRFGINFNQETWYYHQYRTQIEEILQAVKPNFAFGELGNFFTHYGCLVCERFGIKFYDVETSRFPAASVSFFKYDRWDPLKTRDITADEAASFLSQFKQTRPTPDYMVKEKRTSVMRSLKAVFNEVSHRAKILVGYVSGDVFCTQNPVRNFFEKQKIQSKIIQWDRVALTIDQLRRENLKILLYPLQMEPEFNLHVWGYPCNKQQDIILKLSNALPKNWLLVIKLNPKSNQELNELNLTLLASICNIRLVKSNIKMQELDDASELVATVTGTVQIERLLHGKPVVILGNSPFKRFSSIQKPLEEITPHDIMSAVAKKTTYLEQLEISRFLLEHSVPGLMAEPATNQECTSELNVKILASAYLRVLRSDFK